MDEVFVFPLLLCRRIPPTDEKVVDGDEHESGVCTVEKALNQPQTRDADFDRGHGVALDMMVILKASACQGTAGKGNCSPRWIQIASTGAHHQTGRGRQGHGRLYAAPVTHVRHARAIAQMSKDDPPIRSLRASHTEASIGNAWQRRRLPSLCVSREDVLEGSVEWP